MRAFIFNVGFLYTTELGVVFDSLSQFGFLIEAFRPLAFQVIIDTAGIVPTILVTVLYLLLFFFVPMFVFECLFAFLLPSPRCLSFGPPLCLHWPKDMQ